MANYGTYTRQAFQIGGWSRGTGGLFLHRNSGAVLAPALLRAIHGAVAEKTSRTPPLSNSVVTILNCVAPNSRYFIDKAFTAKAGKLKAREAPVCGIGALSEQRQGWRGARPVQDVP